MLGPHNNAAWGAGSGWLENKLGGVWVGLHQHVIHTIWQCESLAALVHVRIQGHAMRQCVRGPCQIAHVPLFGKMAGAVGNYNAHLAAYPDLDWASIAESFVTGLGLQWNPYVTQVCIMADRKSTRLNSSHSGESRMPSSA